MAGCDNAREAVATDTPAAAAISASRGRLRRDMWGILAEMKNFSIGVVRSIRDFGLTRQFPHEIVLKIF
jgi:hypothetical protein